MLHVFIINSFAGKGGFSDSIRQKLEGKKDFNYLVFSSEYSGHESVLAGQICDMFTDEQIRFYSCGGSGTFRNIMKGITDWERVELVECPYGTTNDFQAVFGRNRSRFNNMDDLIDGTVIKTDYITSNLGPVHNTLSTGFDITLLRIAEKLSHLPFSLGQVTYAVAGIVALFTRTFIKAKIVVDGNVLDDSFEQITIANGRILGGTFHVGDSNDPCDGMMDIIIFPRKRKIDKFRYFIALVSDNDKFLSKNCIRIRASKVDIYLHNNGEFTGNFDGEIETGDHLSAKVVKHGLKYVVPEDTMIVEG